MKKLLLLITLLCSSITTSMFGMQTMVKKLTTPKRGTPNASTRRYNQIKPYTEPKTPAIPQDETTNNNSFAQPKVPAAFGVLSKILKFFPGLKYGCSYTESHTQETSYSSPIATALETKTQVYKYSEQGTVYNTPEGPVVESRTKKTFKSFLRVKYYTKNERE